MAWKREYNTGQTGTGELWASEPGRPDATNAITWADDNLWSGIVWTKETIPSSGWTKET